MDATWLILGGLAVLVYLIEKNKDIPLTSPLTILPGYAPVKDPITEHIGYQPTASIQSQQQQQSQLEASIPNPPSGHTQTDHGFVGGGPLLSVYSSDMKWTYDINPNSATYKQWVSSAVLPFAMS